MGAGGKEARSCDLCGTHKECTCSWPSSLAMRMIFWQASLRGVDVPTEGSSWLFSCTHARPCRAGGEVRG
jgi:hypothetical protein